MAAHQIPSGWFQPTKETLDPESGTVAGRLPPWLNGVFLAIGPGKWDFPEQSLNHWLDGCGIITKITIEATGVVKLDKKFLRTEFYKGILTSGKPAAVTFGTRAFPDERKNLFSRLISNYINLEQSDNYSEVIRVGRAFLASGPSCYSQRLDMNKLQLDGDRFDSNKTMGMFSTLGHGAMDEHGDYYLMGVTVGGGGLKFNLLKIPATAIRNSSNSSSCGGDLKNIFKSAKKIASWSNRTSATFPYVHSFTMTDNYVIFIEQPYYATLYSLMSCTMRGESLLDIFKWHPEERNRFIIIDKRTGQVLPAQVTSSEPFFFSHFINSYEENDQIIIDLLAAEDSSPIEQMLLRNLRSESPQTDQAPYKPVRFNVPLTAKNNEKSIVVAAEPLSTRSAMEFPTVNPKFSGKCYTYFYVGQTFQSGFMGQLGKFNVRTGEVEIWKGPADYHVGAPVFIPHPDEAKGEDAGVILAGLASPLETLPSIFVLIDADSWEEVARVEFKHQISPYLHAYFWPA